MEWGESWEKKKKRKKKRQADAAINKSGKLLRARSEIHGDPILPVYHVSTWRKTRTLNCNGAPVQRGQLSVTQEREEFAFVPRNRGLEGGREGKEGGSNCLSIASKIDDIASRKIKPARVLRADKIIGNCVKGEIDGDTEGGGEGGEL